MDQVKIEYCLSLMSQFFDMPEPALINTFYDDLIQDSHFLESLNKQVGGVAQFYGKQFQHVSELHVYRSLLYLLTRITEPEVFVETGVLNGFSSAFILLAMEHNRRGRLISVDLPSKAPEILCQGTGELPSGKSTGWVIPEFLKHRHSLCLGPAEVLLPKVFFGS